MASTYSPSKRVGVIGGMGPAATIRLYEEITRRTPIVHEQDHLRLVIDSDPTVPDRFYPVRQKVRSEPVA